MAAWAGLAEDRRSSATCVIILLYTRKFVSRKTPWAAELMQDKPINKATMKRIFLLFSLLLGVLSAWAYDVELDGIFYNLDKENKTASVASYSYKGAVVIPETISVDGKAYTVTLLGLDEHHDSQLRHEFGRLLLRWLLGLDEHHDSRLRHQFGKWVLLVLLGLDEHHDSQLRHEFGRLLLLWLLGLDEHHDSQLRHQFGRILLLWLLGLDEHHDSQLRHQFGRILLR